jgi:hypothetical protein
MRFIPLMALFLAFNLNAQTPISPPGMGEAAPGIDDTRTGVDPKGSTPAQSHQEYPHSGSTSTRSDVIGDDDTPVTRSSRRAQEQIDAERAAELPLEVEGDFATGPYKDGEYQISVGEERQAEEARPQQRKETRINSD